MINQGLTTDHPEFARAAAGIDSPEVAVLNTGEEIYRFASSAQPSTGNRMALADQESGPWWFRSRDWQRILKRYLTNQLTLGTTARIGAAVQWSWSNMDVLLKARVVMDVEVWEGRGRTQYRDYLPNGIAVTLHGDPDAMQLYVPGMPGVGAMAFQIIDRLDVASSDARGNAVGGYWGL